MNWGVICFLKEKPSELELSRMNYSILKRNRLLKNRNIFFATAHDFINSSLPRNRKSVKKPLSSFLISQKSSLGRTDSFKAYQFLKIKNRSIFNERQYRRAEPGEFHRGILRFNILIYNWIKIILNHFFENGAISERLFQKSFKSKVSKLELEIHLCSWYSKFGSNK